MEENRKPEGDRKPQGYWKDWENVEREFKDITEKIGHFPTVGELRNEDSGHSLERASREYHGGLNAVRSRMGYEPDNERPY